MTEDVKADRRPTTRILIGVSAWLVGTLPFLVQLVSGRTTNSIELYLAAARAVLDGTGIYTTVLFEYPPYALAWFVTPAVFAPELQHYRVAFGLLIWGLDAAVKGALVWHGCRRRDRPIDLVPFLLYALATAAMARIILQRYDVIPAAVSFAGAVLLTSGWPFLAGMAIAAAVGTKLFPALYVPVMLAFAWRRGPRDFWRLVAGGTAATLPLVALAAMVPWWNFLGFHAARGLEAGSIWASVIWLGHYAGVPATWETLARWLEVTGPVAARVVAPARAIWLLTTLVCVGVAVWAALRQPTGPATAGTRDDQSLATLAVLLLLPVTAFVALSLVLSPQFHLWLAPWCALVLFARGRPDLLAGTPGVRRAIACLLFANYVVPVFYPSRTFSTGLDLPRTFVLVFRNALLVYSVWCLSKAIVAFYRRPDPAAPDHGATHTGAPSSSRAPIVK
jgi:hypothetical protein